MSWILLEKLPQVFKKLWPSKEAVSTDHPSQKSSSNCGKTSYSKFKRSILKRRACQIPVASTPITTRCRCCQAQNRDATLCHGTTELNSSSPEDQYVTPEQLVLLPCCQNKKKVGVNSPDSNIQPEMKLHITGLQNDYYLNLLDWSSENLVAIGLKSVANIWNGESNTVTQAIHLNSASTYVSSVSWIGGGTCLAIGTSNGEVQLWDIETQKRLRNMLGHMSVVGALSWNQHILSSGSRLGHIHHHDVRVAQHQIGTQRHQQGICSLKWSPSEKLLASGSSDGLLNIWSYDPGSVKLKTPLQSIPHPTAVKAMNWCPWLSETLAVGGGMTDGQIRIWDTTTGKNINSTNTNSQICSILWLPDTRELATSHGAPGNQVTFWQYPTLTKKTEICGQKGRVLYLALSPDQKRLFSAAANETAVIWKYGG
uniref:CDC20/Fizzy WD40 domain-containing protein n=1 Tax=Pyxicephalus adspersus TaxID=30357 RepID=A0AAV3ADW6_PYXAD|nr:TPA: hypothetical protein GDO54_014482 [Pyxicephalus adspersus]